MDWDWYRDWVSDLREKGRSRSRSGVEWKRFLVPSGEFTHKTFTLYIGMYLVKLLYKF